MSLIAVTINTREQLRYAQKHGADVVELRSDQLTSTGMLSLLDAAKLPVIVSLKTARVISDAVLTHPNTAYVDVDLQDVKRIRHVQGLSAQLIVSYHNYEATPTLAKLQQLIQQMRKHKPAVIKIATQINRFDDLVIIAQLQNMLGDTGIVIGMGELGKMTRIYNKGLLTFAALNQRTASAPGQVPLRKMRDANIFGLVGSGIAYSLSPKIYNYAFRYHKLPYQYQIWDTDSFDNVVIVLEHFHLPGMSITQPFKQLAYEYIRSKGTLDIHAKRIKAVNAISRDAKGRLLGFNTDWQGIEAAIGTYMKKARVLVLGRGGAAKAVEYAAKQANAKHIALLGSKELPTAETNFDVLVNATPVYNQLLTSKDALVGKVVMDCNYSEQTALLRCSRKRARKTFSGMPMLLHQAVGQYKAWTNKALPVAKIAKYLGRKV